MKASLRKDERGLGQLVVIILVVVVLAAIGAVGWKVMKKNNNSPTSTSSNSTPATIAASNATESACNKVYQDTTLCKFAATAVNFNKTPYTAVDTNVDTSGTTSKISIQSDGKGNFALTSEGGGQTYDTIEIGTTVYVKMSGATSWTKYASNAPATTNPADSIKTDFSTTTPAAQRTQYKNLGKEACGSQTCYKYQIIDPASAGTTQYAWFGTNDYRLYQWYSQDSSSGTNTFAITYGKVTISAPSPVVDAASAAAGGSSTPTAAQIQAAEQAAAQSGQ